MWKSLLRMSQSMGKLGSKEEGTGRELGKESLEEGTRAGVQTHERE